MRKIYTLSESEAVGAISLPIIKTNYFTPKLLTDFNALIFSSKNGVRAFAKILPSFGAFPAFAVGSVTGEEIKKFGGSLEYTCEKSNGKNLAEEIAKNYANLRFLWPRAKEVAFDIAHTLKERGAHVNELIIYETICNDSIFKAIKENSIIVFSSPSTVRCFLKQAIWIDTYHAVALGETTAKELKKHNIDCDISPTQNLQNAVEFAKTL